MASYEITATEGVPFGESASKRLGRLACAARFLATTVSNRI